MTNLRPWIQTAVRSVPRPAGAGRSRVSLSHGFRSVRLAADFAPPVATSPYPYLLDNCQDLRGQKGTADSVTHPAEYGTENCGIHAQIGTPRRVGGPSPLFGGRDQAVRPRRGIAATGPSNRHMCGRFVCESVFRERLDEPVDLALTVVDVRAGAKSALTQRDDHPVFIF